MRRIIFALLRAYVAIEQCRFVKWLRGAEPDIVVEPLPQPGVMPEVQATRSVFVDANLGAAYTTDPNGKTLRRCAQNDSGELVYLEKYSKSERKALKRVNRRNGTSAEA